MRTRLTILAVALGLVAPGAATADTATVVGSGQVGTGTAFLLPPTAVAAKSCSGSYTHGVIGGVQKCLRVGQFCAHRYDREYHRYGFNCRKRDARGNYHLTYR